MVVLRRGIWAGMAAMAAGCAPTGRRPPMGNVNSSQLDPQGAYSLADGEGIITGIAAHGYRDRRARFLMPQSFVFDDPGGTRREIPVSNEPGGRTEAIVENGITWLLTPFAIRLPVGQCSILGEAAYFSNQGGLPRWHLLNQPAITFNVVGGRVLYVGRIGMLYQQTEYDSRAKRDADCRNGSSYANVLAGRYFCSYEDFFLAEDAARDLLLVRRQFPVLAAVNIELQPLRSPHPFWQVWPEVVRPVQKLD